MLELEDTETHTKKVRMLTLESQTEGKNACIGRYTDTQQEGKDATMKVHR